MEMASAISKNNDIKLSNSLYGLIEKAVYLPTNSRLCAYCFDYAPNEGRRLVGLASGSINEIARYVADGERIEHMAIGNVRAEICLSKDRQFVMYQFFHFEDFGYKPLSESFSYVGNDVEVVCKLFGI